MRSRHLGFLSTLFLLALSTNALAQVLSDEAQANKPLADIKAFNIHNYYIPSLSELDDQNANTSWLRYAQPQRGSNANSLLTCVLQTLTTIR